MKLKNKKGFTLVELLAVIVILAVIALIAVPIVSSMIKDSKRKTFETSANGLVESAKVYYSGRTEEMDFEGKTFKFGKDIDIKGLNINGKNPTDGEIIVNVDGEVKMYVTDGEYCAFKDFESNVITISEGTECSDHPETPVINLAYNMVTTNRISLIAECRYESGNKIEIEKYEFSKDGGKTWNSRIENNKYLNFYTYDNLEQNTKYNLMARCVTKVGTSAQKGISVETSKIEKMMIDVPDGWDMEKEVTVSYPKGRYTYQYQELDSINDTISEDKWKTIDDENSKWEKVNNHKNSSTHNVFSKVYKENKYIIIRVIDSAGNYVDSASTAIQKIDRTPPVCGNWTGNSTWTNKSVTVKVACNETQDEANNISGCTASTYNVKTYSTTTKTANLSYTIKDNAGNTTECSDIVDVYVDTTAPSLDLGIASTTTSTITVPITINSDSESGIKNTTCVYGTSTSYGKTGTVSNNTCSISGVTAGTTYYYKVVTTNEAGISTTKTGSVKRPTAKTLTYTGNAQTLINAGSSSIGTIEYKLGSSGTYSTSLPSATNAGTYTVYYRITKDGYSTVTDSVSVTIKKKADTITLSPKTYTYDGNTKSTSVTTESGVSSTITYYSNSSCTTTATPKNAGIYYATVKTDGNDNYNAASKGCTKAVVINKASNTLALSANAATYTYPTSGTFTVTKNTSEGSLSCTTSNSNVATCSISGTTVTVKPGTTAGMATITVTSAATENYNAASVAHVATTALGTLSVTATGYNGEYDGQAHGITVTSSGATIKYGTSSGNYTTTTNPTYTEIGTYTVYYQVSKAGYTTVTGSKQVVIKDTTAPSVTVSGIASSWATSDAVSITLSDAGSGLAGYVVTTTASTPSSWTSVTGKSASRSYTATSNGTYYVHVKDSVGLTSYTSFKISYVDTSKPTAPTITGGSTSWKANNQIIWITSGSSSTSGIQKYQYCEMTSNTSSGCTWYDLYNNTSGVNTGIDVAFYHSYYADLINAFGGNVSALNSHYYTNGKSEGRYTSSSSWLRTAQNISTNGVRYIFFRAINNAGTASDASNGKQTSIDTVSPTMDFGPASGTYASGNIVSVGCSDATSGVYITKLEDAGSWSYYEYDNYAYGTSTRNYTAQQLISQRTNAVSTAICTDNAGNSTTQTRTYTITGSGSSCSSYWTYVQGCYNDGGTCIEGTTSGGNCYCRKC